MAVGGGCRGVSRTADNRGWSMIDMSRREMILSATAIAAMANGGAAALAQGATAAGGAQWDLTDLYPSATAWESKRKALAPAVARLTRFKGTLGHGAGPLRTALQEISDTYR